MKQGACQMGVPLVRESGGFRRGGMRLLGHKFTHPVRHNPHLVGDCLVTHEGFGVRHVPRLVVTLHLIELGSEGIAPRA